MAIPDKILILTNLLPKTLIAGTEINNIIYITTNKHLMRLTYQSTRSVLYRQLVHNGKPCHMIC